MAARATGTGPDIAAETRADRKIRWRVSTGPVVTIRRMDFRKQIRRHPAHRPALHRMRPRRDFFDSVPPLTDEEETQFAALQANMAMRLVMQKMQPHPASGPSCAPHEHLPRFNARDDHPRPPAASGWSPVMLGAVGLMAAATLWVMVGGLVLVF